MSKTWTFAILAVLVIAITAASVSGVSAKVIIVLSLLCLGVAGWLYFSVIRQMTVVQNGLYLLQAQDFASRLAKVGNRDADRIVDLFNRLMFTLKEERLKKVEQDKFLQQLIDASPMGIAICTLDGEPITTNRAYNRLMNDTISSEIAKLRPNESITVRCDGSEVFRVSRLWFMERGFQRPFFLIERLTDEIIKVEKQTYSKVIRTLAHEVNNTLGAISSVFETFLEVEKDAELADTLKVCLNRCINLSQFISNYASVVKVPAPSLKPVDLWTEIENMLPLFHDIADKSINIKLEGESQEVNADVALLQQVFINIIKNAVEAIRDAGTRKGEIIVKFDGKTIYFCNNGSVITPDVAANLFSPFYTTKQNGQGVGLMLTAEILRGHKAEFSLNSAESTTVFTIKFP